ncbi:MAG: hypothetical protein Tp118SUR00d2C21406231_32 [Prokaryotic dsDNA virus sp.]|nr:MAG: hypothetical protein Tp125DCM00d2C40298531_51 [Prokaryotic dsDNA virus sp.]QDP53152.1 MAG: hypothetical protein Tp118SUR00d2C21406231_32 [Prokaryotic dsDNA virus sp.]
MSDDMMPCEICGPENKCKCGLCQCASCVPDSAYLVQNGGVVDLVATREEAAKARLLWQLRVFGQ